MTTTVKSISLTALAIALAIGGYFTASIPQAKAVTSLENVQAGDLVKGQSLSTVYYYGVDGYRYVFPNSKTYFTWYEDFSSVKTISDSDLTKIQIGGNVTYKPASRMVKIQSDPKTYAVAEGGVLRHITSEEVAIDLYGSTWNQQIDDIADGFFTNYEIGEPISSSTQFNVNSIRNEIDSINDDKDLIAPANIEITANGFSPIDVTIEAGQSVRFTNNDAVNHNATDDNLKWGTGTLTPGKSKIISFEEPGTYTFFDGLDSSNTGAIFVQ